MNILPQHTQAAFNRFRPFLIAALEAYPKHVIFPLTAARGQLAATTFVARLRDARNALIRYDWPLVDGFHNPATTNNITKIVIGIADNGVDLVLGPSTTQCFYGKTRKQVGQAVIKNEATQSVTLLLTINGYIAAVAACSFLTNCKPVPAPVLELSAASVSEQDRNILETSFPDLTFAYDETNNILRIV